MYGAVPFIKEALPQGRLAAALKAGVIASACILQCAGRQLHAQNLAPAAQGEPPNSNEGNTMSVTTKLQSTIFLIFFFLGGVMLTRVYWL